MILGPLTVSNYPAFFTNLGVENFPGVPFLSWSVVIFLVLAIATGVVLHMTPFGRSLYAIGLDREAALHAGIRVQRVKMLLFVLSGVVCSLVGMLYTFELSSAGEDIAIGFELKVITIVLLGGVSIFGGVGTIVGVALAAFVYAGLHSVLLLSSSFNDNDFQVVSGGLLILSVLVPNLPSFAQRSARARRRRAARPRGRAERGAGARGVTARGPRYTRWTATPLRRERVAHRRPRRRSRRRRRRPRRRRRRRCARGRGTSAPWRAARRSSACADHRRA